MQTGKILVAGIAGTSAMTLFSYLVSDLKNKNIREPELLSELIKRLPVSHLWEYAQLAGLKLHYAIGISFVACYSSLWEKTKVKPSWASGTLIGTANGLIGVMGWKMMFKAHPNLPEKNLKPFFGHLMTAHVVFGIFSAITYRLISDRNSAELG